jgi:hypothetical protein
LIRLGHERDVAFAHANPSGQVLDDSELSDRCDILNELEYAIQDTPAQTLAGLAVKARIAREYIPPKCPDGRILDDIVPILIEDILRLAKISAKEPTLKGEQQWHDPTL